MSINPTEITRHPWETKPGDVITRHPDEWTQRGEWTITSKAQTDGWFQWLDYEMSDGSTGRFVLKPGQVVTVASLASDTYRDELADVARGDDTGPHPIPTDEQIEAVLGDLPDHGAETAESEAS